MPTATRRADDPGGRTEGYPDTFKQLVRAFSGFIDAGAPRPAPFPTFAHAVLARSASSPMIR